jgi:uncharacterized hydrophobic protein (TIGR00271 family)
MSIVAVPTDGPETPLHSLASSGKLGFRGRRATAEEQAQVMDAFFFEGKRRIPYLQQFFVLMILSATIAGLGLANDSAAVVIGAMLVAPLMTPILAIAASLTQGWARRMMESLGIVGAGALCAIGVGLVLSWFIPFLRTGLPLPDEILARTNPNLLDLGIALAAGAAGGFVAVRTDASGALPGVGIAVALVPPLATAGIVIGLGQWDLAFGALLLFLTNLVAIVFAASVVLVAAGFAAYRDEGGGRQAKMAASVVVVAIVVVGIPLLAHSLQRLEHSVAVVEAARNVQDWAPALTLDGVQIDRFMDPVQVTVEVTGEETPPDVSVLAGLIAEDLGTAVDVDVIFVPLASGSAPAP